jgi:hypothetical protein
VPEARLEFQDFVAQSLGPNLPLFGHDLFVEAPSTFAPLDQEDSADHAQAHAQPRRT